MEGLVLAHIYFQVVKKFFFFYVSVCRIAIGEAGVYLHRFSHKTFFEIDFMVETPRIKP